MRAALIPPKGFERTALESDIHLVLPLPSLMHNMTYLSTYAEARKRGDYLILDNGCAEGQLVDGNRLLEVARALRVHEIVAPDVMNNTNATYLATTEFIDKNPEAADYNIMAVLQGQDHDERRELLRKFFLIESITAIGIPKVLVRRDGDTIRLDIVDMINRMYPKRFDIHLLGLNGVFPTEILDSPFDAGSFRSMDSTQPYKVTEENNILTPEQAWAKRREDYFTRKKEVNVRTLAHNIDVFLNWAAMHES